MESMHVHVHRCLRILNELIKYVLVLINLPSSKK
jgi:hypothetical protein